MNAIEILHYYLMPNQALYDVVYRHSRSVADKALQMAAAHPDLPVDRLLLEQAALLHDIGVCRVDAPSIFCYGTEPYIRHGLLGGALLRALKGAQAGEGRPSPAAGAGTAPAAAPTPLCYATPAEQAALTDATLEACARVCERHTGTGLTLEDIRTQALPLPLQDYSPQSLEEELICFADKFFSKTHLDRERDPQQARSKLEKFGEESLRRFDNWAERFL